MFLLLLSKLPGAGDKGRASALYPAPTPRVPGTLERLLDLSGLPSGVSRPSVRVRWRNWLTGSGSSGSGEGRPPVRRGFWG